jgi:hypothetical protein
MVRPILPAPVEWLPGCCVRLLLVLELHREALPHTERGFSVKLLELWASRYFFALTEQSDFAFSEFFLKEKLASQEKFTNYDNIQKRVIYPINLTVLSHPLV